MVVKFLTKKYMSANTSKTTLFMSPCPLIKFCILTDIVLHVKIPFEYDRCAVYQKLGEIESKTPKMNNNCTN